MTYSDGYELDLAIAYGGDAQTLSSKKQRIRGDRYRTGRGWQLEMNESVSSWQKPSSWVIDFHFYI
jgi:hypothetical protein